MSDIDYVFARFSRAGATETPSRQTVNIPARGTRGSRVVQVVHLRHGAKAIEDAPARHAPNVGGAAWGAEISGKGPPLAPAVRESAAPSAPEPVVHVLPAWEPRRPVTEQIIEAPALRHKRIGLPRAVANRSTRRVADPFDTSDDGTNCMRCGYLVEPAREKRGLMTCGGCG